MHTNLIETLHEELSQKLLPKHSVYLYHQTRKYKWELGTHINISTNYLRKTGVADKPLAEIWISPNGNLNIRTYLHKPITNHFTPTFTHEIYLLADPRNNLREIISQLITDITEWTKK